MPLISTVTISLDDPPLRRKRGRPPKNPSLTLEGGEPRTVRQSSPQKNINHKPIRTGDEKPCLGNCERNCLLCSIHSFGRDQKGWPTLILKRKQTSLNVTIAEKPLLLPKRKVNVSPPHTTVASTISTMKTVDLVLEFITDEDELDLFS